MSRVLLPSLLLFTSPAGEAGLGSLGAHGSHDPVAIIAGFAVLAVPFLPMKGRALGVFLAAWPGVALFLAVWGWKDAAIFWGLVGFWPAFFIAARASDKRAPPKAGKGPESLDRQTVFRTGGRRQVVGDGELHPPQPLRRIRGNFQGDFGVPPRLARAVLDKRLVRPYSFSVARLRGLG